MHHSSVSCVSVSDFSNTVVSFQQGDQVHKSVFIIFFQGDQLKNRVKKICEGWVLESKMHQIYLNWTLHLDIFYCISVWAIIYFAKL